MSPTHAGIRDLHIRDFRGIDDLTLSFVGPKDYPTQVVVIGGPNGCGKTAVLEACLLAGGHGKLVRGKSGSDAVRLGQGDFLIEAKLQDANTVHPVTCTSRKPGRQIVPFWYFSSWRAPNCRPRGRDGRKTRQTSGQDRGEPALAGEAVPGERQSARLVPLTGSHVGVAFLRRHARDQPHLADVLSRAESVRGTGKRRPKRRVRRVRRYAEGPLARGCTEFGSTGSADVCRRTGDGRGRLEASS